MMVGEHITLDIDRTEVEETHRRIDVRGLTVRNREGLRVLDNVSFIARSGQILGVRRNFWNRSRDCSMWTADRFFTVRLTAR